MNPIASEECHTLGRLLALQLRLMQQSKLEIVVPLESDLYVVQVWQRQPHKPEVKWDDL